MSTGYWISIYQLIRRNIPEDFNFQTSVTFFVFYGNKLMNLAEEFSVRITKSVTNCLLCFCVSIVVVYNIRRVAVFSPLKIFIIHLLRLLCD